jgi:hemerythrin superfamily protein
MDVLELLKEDHQRVASLLEQVEKTTERAEKTREELFTKIMNELTLHAELEEQLFYPEIEQQEETREITLEAYEEHRLVKQLLAELSSEAKNTEEWSAKFKVLKENIEHHVEEEESEMFKGVRKVLSKEEREEMGIRLMEAKKRSLSAGA